MHEKNVALDNADDQTESSKMWRSNTVPKIYLKNKPKNISATLKKPMPNYSSKNEMSVVSREAFEELYLNDYERLRIVGQGSFGIAILYSKKSDKSLVVFKQINLADLTSFERELAMNEVNVFSKLHHPNIIRYLGSFIRDNILLIEMEYADKGTLSQIIARQQKMYEHFPERFILSIFEQTTSAINYMHSENILHRDLKTANVFLCGRGIVKIGDFGIAKVMSSNVQAQTVLGTPYYLSPEMCEGKDYDTKSDVWAVGCILNEMCCLRKTFAATNLAELVTKIMAAQYARLPSGYSEGLKTLINIILQVDPAKRPCASEILKYWIPLIYRNLGKKRGYEYHGEKRNSNGSISIKTTAENHTPQTLTNTNTSDSYYDRSVLYQLKSFGKTFSLSPLQLPTKLRIKTVSTNGLHFIAISEDGNVYAWGEGAKGQLGLTAQDTWRHYPSRVESLNKYHITDACVGDAFSIFLANCGTILSCGDDSKSSLGHGDRKNYNTPTIIKKLEGIQITQIASGSEHVLALSLQENVYSWGTSKCGALGLGSTITVSIPQCISNLGFSSKIKKLLCGSDCSVILLDNGEVYVCGSNSYEKLGFSSRTKCFTTFKKIPIQDYIVDVSASSINLALLVRGGFVVTLGGNMNGQRGLGNLQPVKSLFTPVTGIKYKHIRNVKCNNGYMVVCTDDDILSLWGTRYGIPDPSLQSNTTDSNDGNMILSRSSTASTSTNEFGNSTTAFTNFLASVHKSEVILDPIDILALHTPDDQIEKGYYVNIGDIYPLSHSILVLVHTNSPQSTNSINN